MSQFQQQPFDGGNPFAARTQAATFANNPSKRCPVVLLLDTSGSMVGDPIAELNAGLVQLKDELVADATASKSVELAVVTFGPVTVERDFQTVRDFDPPVLTASGDTPMGAAITRALALLRERKDTYKSYGIDYFRPWVFLITDGAPTDSWAYAAQEVRDGEAANGFSFYAVAVQNADLDILSQISVKPPKRLKGLAFSALFAWLSSSVRDLAKSAPGEKVPLENPSDPDGWAYA